MNEEIYKEIKKKLDNGEEVIINNLDRADKVILKKAKTEVVLADVKIQIEQWKQVETIEYRRDDNEVGENYRFEDNKIVFCEN